MKTEDGISEIIGEILILGLIVLIAVILAATVFGHVLPIEKSAYVATQFGTKEAAGKTVITAYDLGGGPGILQCNLPRKVPCCVLCGYHAWQFQGPAGPFPPGL